MEYFKNTTPSLESIGSSSKGIIINSFQNGTDFAYDDDLSDGSVQPTPEKGYLSKWTNMLHGWQERYFVLKSGVLSYYKCKDDDDKECRGSIQLKNAHIQPHAYDDCRIDIRLGDLNWYFRCPSTLSRKMWMSAIETHRHAESGYGSEQALPSTCSLQSLNSFNCFNNIKQTYSLTEKLTELENFKEILNRQVDRLQLHFDVCSHISSMAENDDSILDLSKFDSLLDPELLDSMQSCTPKGNTAENECFRDFDLESMHSGCTISSQNENMSQVDDNWESDRSVATVVEEKEGDKKQEPKQRSFLSRFLPFRSSNVAKPTSENMSKTQLKNTRMLDLGILVSQFGGNAVNFKAEAVTFKATTAGILMNMMHCIESMHQREEYWHRRIEREKERRLKTETALSASRNERMQQQGILNTNQFGGSIVSTSRLFPGKAHQRSHSHSGQLGNMNNTLSAQVITAPTVCAPTQKFNLFNSPDCEEGPNFLISEEHFYDAIDAQLDKMEQDEACLNALKSVECKISSANAMPETHPLFSEVEKVSNDRVNILRGYLAEIDNPSGWQVIAQKGEMTIYNREVESADGTYLDPLQAVHTVYKVTGREMCSAFWDVHFRLDWEITVDHAPTVIEVCSDSTILQYQVYKRIWPATQRDSLFWSQIRCLDSTEFRKIHKPSNEILLDTWMVVNYSTDYNKEKIPPSSTPFIRLEVDVELFCQTIWTPPAEFRDLAVDSLTPSQLSDLLATKVDREDVRCRLLYASQINPGGWAPAAVIRTLAKREYPHFLQRISDFAISHNAKKVPQF